MICTSIIMIPGPLICLDEARFTSLTDRYKYTLRLHSLLSFFGKISKSLFGNPKNSHIK